MAQNDGMKKLLLLAALLLNIGAFAQNERPKLVVGIVVDQMRFDYLYKYWNRYGNEGLKRMINEGYQCKNLQFNYVPTYTAPGHAAIYTGTTPARNGMIANDWYDRKKAGAMYCTEDPSVATVGAATVKVGKMSPRNMLSTTVSDELRIATNKKGKVIGVSLKDRGAILPAGHLGNAAYWFDGESGNWVSSTFYMTELPKWLQDFNAKQSALIYLKKGWNTLYPIESYTASLPDKNNYETPFKGKTEAVFPYLLDSLMAKNGGQNLIKATPYGNTFTKDIALAAIDGESLGKDEITDMLCVSFSSTDFVGHQFGPDAIEMEDTYLRFDQDIADFLKQLDTKVGKGEYLVFLSADHGGATVPAYLMDERAPGGYMNYAPMEDSIKSILKRKFDASDWFLEIQNDQIYLNETKIAASKFSLETVEEYLAEKLIAFDGVHSITTASRLNKNEYSKGTLHLVQQGFYGKRSGNVIITLEPNWMEYSKTGTTHGSPYSYDTRVPMLWYGWKIQKGETVLPYFINDIAPTVSWLLNIPFPNATSGNPIPLPINK